MVSPLYQLVYELHFSGGRGKPSSPEAQPLEGGQVRLNFGSHVLEMNKRQMTG